MKLHHIILIVAIALLTWFGFSRVQSALPPRVVVIETGPVGGTYFRNAERYAQVMEQRGFEITPESRLDDYRRTHFSQT